MLSFVWRGKYLRVIKFLQWLPVHVCETEKHHKVLSTTADTNIEVLFADFILK